MANRTWGAKAFNNKVKDCFAEITSHIIPMTVVLTLEVKTLVGNVTNDCSAGVCETVVDSVVVCNGNVLVLLGVTVSIVILKVSEPIVFEVFTNCCFRVANDIVVVIVEGVVVVVVVVILFADCRVVLVLSLSIVVSVADVCVGVRPFCIIFDEDVGKSGNDTGPMKGICGNKLWQSYINQIH